MPQGPNSSHTPGSARSIHYGDIPLEDLLVHNLDLSEHSHLELSAARDVLRNAWKEIQVNHIRLPSSNYSQDSRLSHLASFSLRAPKSVKHLLEISIDIVVSLAFAFFLIAIFVAESTGAVLSADIFSDALALSTSSACNLAPSSPRSEMDA